MQLSSQATTTTTTTTPSHSLLLLLLLPSLLLLLVTSPAPSAGMDIHKLCQARCYYGKGGNLCNCNAFHFAGKRGDDAVGVGVGGREEEEEEREEDEEALHLQSSRPLMELAALRGDVESPAPRRRHHGALEASAAALAARRDLRGHGLHDSRDMEEGEDDGREVGQGRRRAGQGAEASLVGGGLLVDAAEGEQRAAVAVNRLNSLIRAALDERLVDNYRASRKRKQGALPYEEADFVY
ncbi:uncharacterized protein LOC143290139 [Babylonia areolata]|uniref:uncharacterized protein LOC143290139 n=1 Tax=Babylonia areolata TaxID=304850 RepID=UPI003FD355B3